MASIEVEPADLATAQRIWDRWTEDGRVSPALWSSRGDNWRSLALAEREVGPTRWCLLRRQGTPVATFAWYEQPSSRQRRIWSDLAEESATYLDHIVMRSGPESESAASGMCRWAAVRTEQLGRHRLRLDWSGQAPPWIVKEFGPPVEVRGGLDEEPGLVRHQQAVGARGRLLWGRPVADELRTKVAREAAAWRARGIVPKLAVVWVQGDPASENYAQTKLRTAEKLGITVELHRHPANVSEADVAASIHRLNEDDSVHGILLELPLPSSLSADRLMAALDPLKDVDGLAPSNRLALINGQPGLYPATPLASIRLLQYYDYSLQGKNVTLVGCGRTVGAPLLQLLLQQHATVTVCHVYTEDLKVHLQSAEIALVAVGQAKLISPSMVHPNLVLVDIGVTPLADGGIAGDVDPAALDRVAALTPTPGGVGVVTTAEIFANLIRAMQWRLRSQTSDIF